MLFRSERKAALTEGSDPTILTALDDLHWNENRGLCEQARPILLRLCAHYLLCEQDEGRALDPVAAFHLGNGASVEQINWLANVSESGLKQSFGIMVNYAYRPLQIERNHEAYVKQGRIAASDQVKTLLRNQPSVRARE